MKLTKKNKKYLQTLTNKTDNGEIEWIIMNGTTFYYTKHTSQGEVIVQLQKIPNTLTIRESFIFEIRQKVQGDFSKVLLKIDTSTLGGLFSFTPFHNEEDEFQDSLESLFDTIKKRHDNKSNEILQEISGSVES
jgi:hypothetical protein